jgi:hypothetical protein
MIVYTDVEVDVDLGEFSDDELMEEVHDRNLFNASELDTYDMIEVLEDRGVWIDTDNVRNLANKILLLKKDKSEYTKELENLLLLITGRYV